MHVQCIFQVDADVYCINTWRRLYTMYLGCSATSMNEFVAFQAYVGFNLVNCLKKKRLMDKRGILVENECIG